ncbi:probable pectin methyltransferase QUA2 [Spinacia oleracea]|uniref:Methyltransferase n=1 Tax=Spinacia oleracea TaxID=3562 RepID=A0ABM3QL94_SPIOL|nr:probable pectin methyltransferase QUA2 [Spinacia oleracea]
MWNDNASLLKTLNHLRSQFTTRNFRCEAFPTYPRTYDMVHADGLLTLEGSQRRCNTFDIFVEIDRILRPEGWAIFRDKATVIESMRPLVARLKWEARVIEIESNNDEKLFVCQKPFFKRHTSQ